jgi:hypothetical protein
VVEEDPINVLCRLAAPWIMQDSPLED